MIKLYNKFFYGTEDIENTFSLFELALSVVVAGAVLCVVIEILN